jgi:hypothetical protein
MTSLSIWSSGLPLGINSECDSCLELHSKCRIRQKLKEMEGLTEGGGSVKFYGIDLYSLFESARQVNKIVIFLPNSHNYIP